MAVEQKWLAVSPQLFTASGSTLGIITIADTAGFKVKQRVIISATGQPDLTVQCKRVISNTQLIVGPMPTQQGRQSITTRSDVSAYTTGNGAFIYAEEQDKSKLTMEDMLAAVYEQEPTVAIRVLGVDQYGNPYTAVNRFPVDASVSVSSVEIIDSGGDELDVQPDGSINVNVLNASASVPSDPYIENISAPLANTEYSFTFPAKTIRFIIKIR